MLFTTATEWAALALTLLGGWLLGLASHPGGRKWRDRYNAERDAHAAVRRDYEAKLTATEERLRTYDADRGRLAQSDARIAELERDRAALVHANERIAELERENARLRTTPAPMPTGMMSGQPAPVATRAAPVAAPEPMPLTRRVVGGSSKRGWFDWGPGGDSRARRV
ncbi:hypothetical protein [Sphingomonas lenta]|uniref:Uncharacterized protein n=1 Tax=Sphingomonas lenta TaxID=1141887 RepID=A0A2A2SJY2_9SPHN|nr:hypothetical protein [Sphingomonas lenta]PAX09460.1 hypothetical protein CKY28_01515 [Sphingomonas lenta]